MNQIIPFMFKDTAAVIRVVEIDGEPWFVGKDVAEALGYARPNDALQQHCKGAVKRRPLRTAGGVQELRVLSEPDVLRLIVGSRLPEAERFERWVFEEVLPTIRRTGQYGAPAPAVDPMAVLSDPAAMRGLLLTYTEKVLALQSAVAEQAPKVLALDRIATASEGAINITEAAKCLQVRPRELFRWLHANAWIYRRPGGSGWVAYQPRLQQGVLEHKITTVSRSDGTEKVVEHVRVTAKGLARLGELLEKEARSA